jgi:hypothetical protein
MSLSTMRFKGVQWHHNPREITFDADAFVSEYGSPDGEAYIQSTGRKNMKIRGRGTLYGANCLEQFVKLYRLFREGGSGVLSVEGIGSLHAVFESLSVTGKPKPDMLEYAFVFREVMAEKRRGRPAEVTAANGENLWDISYRFGIAVETLLELNPDVKRPDILQEGQVIALC